jgi:hypothetical protein
MFCCFIDCEFNIGHFFWEEGTSVNVDNNIEPETIETREISEIKNNSEPDLHLNTHDLDTVPKEVNYLVQEIFIGGVLFIMYYRFCLTYNVAFIIFSASPNNVKFVP